MNKPATPSNTQGKQSRLLPDDYIQNVLKATDIVAVIGEHVTLRKAGAESIGSCPFHDEKTGSFNVNGAKGAYYCRGCGAKGNAITFLKEQVGMSFNDAIEALAVRAKLPKPSDVRPGNNGAPSEGAGEYRQLSEILERAKALYQKELPKNKAAMDYLHSRGVTNEMIKDFQIGYAPGGWRFIVNSMKDVPIPMLVKAGLVAQKVKEDGVSSYDNLRDRIIFPIQNLAGNTIAFGGRALQEGERKYLNTPETMLFQKGSELYGWNEGKQQIAKQKSVIVTEGYLDTVIPSGYGVKNIVSAMGATVQSNTIDRLLKTAEHIIYCFDGDKAGVCGAQRALEQSIGLVDAKHKVSFAFLPDGFDPDEYVLKHGAEKFQDLCYKNAEPMSKFLIRDISSRFDMTEVEGKAAFAADAMALVDRMQPGFMKDSLASAVRKQAGLPDPGPSSTADQPKLQVPVPAPKNLSSTAPPRSIFNRNRGSLTPPALVAPEPPTLSLRMVGMLINDVDAAKLFNPKWAVYDNKAKPEEVDCIRSIVEIANDTQNPVKNMDELIGRLQGTPSEAVINKAKALQERTVANDPIEELSKLANYLVQCKQREMKRQALFAPKQ